MYSTGFQTGLFSLFSQPGGYTLRIAFILAVCSYQMKIAE